RHLDAALPERLEKRGREMQPCGWRRHGSARPCKHRLIAIAIGSVGWPFDVWRQRYVTDCIDDSGYTGSLVGQQANDAAPVKAALQHFAAERPAPVEYDLGARLELLAGMHQGFPELTS